MLNKKGTSFLDTLFSLTLLLIAILMICSFNIFINKMQKNVEEKSQFFIQVNNIIEDTYVQDTAFVNYEVPGPEDTIHVSYKNHVETTKYNTESIILVIDYRNTHKEFLIERIKQ